jgi:hypothetical protein
LELSALWDSAPFGTERRLELSAVWDVAPFALRAVWDVALLWFSPLATVLHLLAW